MLQELKVQNFAIIENLHIDFKKGLNIISGETGAGKSILLKSLSLLMGVKGSAESIRTGCESASIQGSFLIKDRPDIMTKLSELGIDIDDDHLIVRRLISEEKSRVYLNGTLCTLNDLRTIVSPLIEVAGNAAPLIEMTGQHDNRHLLSKAYHLDLLDQYVGAFDLRHQVSELFEKRNTLANQLVKLNQDNQVKTQRIDFLKYQRDEIRNFNPQIGEETSLESQVKKLKNSSKIGIFVDLADIALYSDDDSATSRLHTIIQKSAEINHLDPEIAKRLENLQTAKGIIEDCIYDLRQYVSKIDSDASLLDKLEARWSDLRKLQKKYGSSCTEMLALLEKIESELAQLENSEVRASEIEKEIVAIDIKLTKLSEELHQKRSKGSGLLEDSVNAELLDLNMKGVTFSVFIEKLQSLSMTGVSDVEFMSKTSPKDPARPLAKFASGGELSRVLLSLKRVIGTSQLPRTYLFDEVDTGVSGNTAEKVGRKLKSIAGSGQVICVTHLPQVAAFGDVHFNIQKSPTAEGASMNVTHLKAKERINEIARLISGEKISKTSLAHAEELLKEAQA